MESASLPRSVVPEPLRFVGPDSEEWVVKEVDTSGLLWAQADSCLVFTSTKMVRRVWTYPTGWSGLSPRELFELSWRT